jgi:hypothetical protein
MHCQGTEVVSRPIAQPNCRNESADWSITTNPIVTQISRAGSMAGYSETILLSELDDAIPPKRAFNYGFASSDIGLTLPR